MKYEVLIEDTGESYSCDDQESVLNGMVRLGRKGIPVGCCGGGCGICKVEVISGTYTEKVMSRYHVSQDDQANGRVLSCRIKPKSRLTLKIIGKFRKAVCKDHC